MADITDLPVVTDLQATDLIHLGRPSASAGNQDPTILGSDFFTAVNRQGALVGTPTVPGGSLTANVRANPVNYGANIGQAGVLDEAAGTITINVTGTYRARLDLIMQAAGEDNLTFASFLVWGGGEIGLGGATMPNASGAAPDPMILSASGGTLVSLTAGDVLHIEVESTLSMTGVTFPNGVFEIHPLFA